MALDCLIYSIELGNGHCTRTIHFYVNMKYISVHVDVISIYECFTKGAAIISWINVFYVYSSFERTSRKYCISKYV